MESELGSFVAGSSPFPPFRPPSAEVFGGCVGRDCEALACEPPLNAFTIGASSRPIADCFGCGTGTAACLGGGAAFGVAVPFVPCGGAGADRSSRYRCSRVRCAVADSARVVVAPLTVSSDDPVRSPAVAPRELIRAVADVLAVRAAVANALVAVA